MRCPLSGERPWHARPCRQISGRVHLHRFQGRRAPLQPGAARLKAGWGSSAAVTAEPSAIFRYGVSDGALSSSVPYVNPGRSIYQSRSYWIPGPYVPIDLLYLSLLTPVVSPNPLLYQSLPTSIYDRHAMRRRRKDDIGLGTATRGI